MTPYILYNLLQVAFALGLSPLFAGIISRGKEMVQSKRGPSVFQPYRDLRKLFRKDEVVSEDATWIFRFTPYVVFITPIFVTLLIPVLTRFPLFFAFAGDMLAAGSVLALGGFFSALAAIDTANPYGPMGASRTRMVSFLAEPVFMIILAEAGRIPVDNPTGHFELAMIDESKGLEYSGRAAALMKWGGFMKLTVLMIVFLNVLLVPWGLSPVLDPARVFLAVLLVAAKILGFIIVLVFIESSLAKLRLFRITEFLGAAFVICVAAMISQLFIGGAP